MGGKSRHTDSTLIRAMFFIIDQPPEANRL